MIRFTVSNLLIWLSEAGKGEKMQCDYKKKNAIMPVFGKEPETGVFIADLRIGE